MLAAEPAVPVNQYTLTSARISSRGIASSGSAWPELVYSLNFSTIHASWPAGESVSA